MSGQTTRRATGGRHAAGGPPVGLAAIGDSHAVKTYRYLRLAMVLLVVGLAAAIAVEWGAVGRECFPTSISAYYYTPARGVFVASLLAIGVCLVTLKGGTEAEDALLNVAGILAPVVGYVPIANAGSCTSSVVSTEGRDANVENNVTALLVVGAVALVATVLITLVENGSVARVPAPYRLGIAASIVLWTGGVLVFALGRSLFLERAHYAAAIAMFACIVAVVALNARGLGRENTERGTGEGGRAYANRYAVVLALMAASVGVLLLWRVLFGLEHVVLWIEGALIALFAVFWALQTAELWHRGQREDPAAGQQDRVIDLNGERQAPGALTGARARADDDGPDGAPGAATAPGSSPQPRRDRTRR